MVDSSHAPGCYASAFLFETGSATCAPCLFQESCGPEARARRARIFAAHGVDDPELTIKVPVLGPKAAAIVADFDAAATLARLKAGENPFGAVPFLAIAAHLMLKVDGPIARDTIKAAIMRRLSIAKSPAETQMRTAVQVLQALGAVRAAEGMIRRMW